MEQNWWTHSNVSASVSKTEALDLYPQSVLSKLTHLSKCHAILPVAQDKDPEVTFDSFFSQMTSNPSASPLASPSRHPESNHFTSPPYWYLAISHLDAFNSPVSILVIILAFLAQHSVWSFKNLNHIMLSLSSKPPPASQVTEVKTQALKMT